MAIWVGTSGYQYPEWRGRFYPAAYPAEAMLAYYASHFRTVEINYTFHRFPTAAALQGWTSGTPADFVLALRAPRRITHELGLRNARGLSYQFLSRAQLVGDKLGPVLFQIPPELALDLGLWADFLAMLPAGQRLAFEFRNPDWLVEAVVQALADAGFALCVSDSQTIHTPVVRTTSWSYFRLRDEGYAADDLQRWAVVLRDWSAGGDQYVYFRHEATARGPELARQLIELLNTA